MSYPMTLEWKWKIGDIVTHAVFDQSLEDRGRAGLVQRFLILGRMADECAGSGWQKVYRIRIVDADIGIGFAPRQAVVFLAGSPGGLWHLHEEELADLAPTPKAPAETAKGA